MSYSSLFCLIKELVTPYPFHLRPLPPVPPVPCPNLYAQLNALQLVLDPRSLVWINLFALDLRQSLEQFMEIYKLNDLQKPDEHVDIKVDGLMLKVKRTADA